MDEPSNKSIAFLPWAEYKEPVTFGRITICPFSESLLKEERISERFFRCIQRNFGCYVQNTLRADARERENERRTLVPEPADTQLSAFTSRRLQPSRVSVIAYDGKLPDFYEEEPVSYPVDEIEDTITLLSLLATWNLTYGEITPHLGSFMPANWEMRILEDTRSDHSQEGVVQVRSGGYIETGTIMRTGLAIATRPAYSRGWCGFDDAAHTRDEVFFEYAKHVLLDYKNASLQDWFHPMIRAIRVCNRSLTNAEFQDKREMIGEMILLLTTALNVFHPECQKGSELASAIAKDLGGVCRTTGDENRETESFLTALYKIRSKFVHGHTLKFQEAVHDCIANFGDPYPLGRYAFGLCCKALLRDYVGRTRSLAQPPDDYRQCLDFAIRAAKDNLSAAQPGEENAQPEQGELEAPEHKRELVTREQIIEGVRAILQGQSRSAREHLAEIPDPPPGHVCLWMEVHWKKLEAEVEEILAAAPPLLRTAVRPCLDNLNTLTRQSPVGYRQFVAEFDKAIAALDQLAEQERREPAEEQTNQEKA